VTTATRAVTGLATVAVAVAGTGYTVGDILTLATGTNGKVRVETITTGGAVATVSIYQCGTNYT